MVKLIFLLVLLLDSLFLFRIVVIVIVDDGTIRIYPTQRIDRMNFQFRIISRSTSALRKKRSKSPGRTASIERNVESIFQACAKGHKDIVRALLAKAGNQIDLARMDPMSGQTAFHLACSGGHISIVHQLMNKFGSDVCNHLVNGDGKTALEVAAEAGAHSLVRDILSTVTRKQSR